MLYMVQINFVIKKFQNVIYGAKKKGTDACTNYPFHPSYFYHLFFIIYLLRIEI